MLTADDDRTTCTPVVFLLVLVIITNAPWWPLVNDLRFVVDIRCTIIGFTIRLVFIIIDSGQGAGGHFFLVS
jgi:hypothetical protein